MTTINAERLRRINSIDTDALQVLACIVAFNLPLLIYAFAPATRNFLTYLYSGAMLSTPNSIGHFYLFSTAICSMLGFLALVILGGRGSKVALCGALFIIVIGVLLFISLA